MLDRLLGTLVSLLLRLLRRIDPDRAAGFCGAVARRLGPLTPVHKIGRDNLRAAFPDADPAWIERTLRGAWDNLGRVAGEYVHLGALWDFNPEHPDPNGRIVTDDQALFYSLRNDGKPALCFAAHLANWELPAVAASRHGLPSAVIYRMPNNRAVAAEIARIRQGLMGRLIRSRSEAALEMAGALAAGEHLGMLVDQHWSRGPLVTFFGRPCRANPTLARLARQFPDCPVIGVRAIRLGGSRFRLAATGPISLPRTAAGEIDVPAATQLINTIVEGWVREHPEQWLWFHRRWR
ncbi:MAG: lipid A biosynthesis lauroyl acyltransferase [Acetobacteraceae bacterium]|nr:lipid A biosynthesis lauroyl acyltransferase [Acetobacteraceae bacterium]